MDPENKNFTSFQAVDKLVEGRECLYFFYYDFLKVSKKNFYIKKGRKNY